MLLLFFACVAPSIGFLIRTPAHTLGIRTHGIDSTQASTSLRVTTEEPLVAVDEMDLIQSYSETAIRCRGQSEGLRAMEALASMCRRRCPYDFDEERHQGTGSVLSHAPELLPREVTEKISDRVCEMERKGWLSTNPDSVDGLPSFHLNLISNGKPLVPSDGDVDDFEAHIRDLTGLVEPYVYDKLLPRVNTLLNTTNIRVADVFLRRYGQDLIDGKSRNGISAHYDVYSRVTSVIALDDVAVQGQNGLYTTEVTDAQGNTPGRTSNHAGLRRFFPLACGDAVVHTWDVLHGVDVEPDLTRTSMIVWFTTGDESATDPSPWLTQDTSLTDNHVTQFVLASALESASSPVDGVDSRPMGKVSTSSDDTVEAQVEPYQLYLDSASRANTFALTRLGSLCEEESLSKSDLVKAAELLDMLRPVSQLPVPLQDQSRSHASLAQRFWFEGAIRGNPLAQTALADEIMIAAFQSPKDNTDARLLAAVLFAMAAQQGYSPAQESLMRVCQVEASVVDQADIEESAIFQTVAVALG